MVSGELTATAIVIVKKMHKLCNYLQFGGRGIYSVFLGLGVYTDQHCWILLHDISNGRVFPWHLPLHSINGEGCCGNIE